MVLIIVLVHAVAPGQLEVGQVLEPAANDAPRGPGTRRRRPDRPWACARRSRRSRRLAATRPIESISRRPSAIKSASDMVHRSSPSKQKYSSPRLVLLGSGTRSGDQFLKFWIRPEPHLRARGCRSSCRETSRPGRRSGRRVRKSRYLSDSAARTTSGGAGGFMARISSRIGKRRQEMAADDSGCGGRRGRGRRTTSPPFRRARPRRPGGRDEPRRLRSRIRSRATSHIWPGPSRGY